MAESHPEKASRSHRLKGGAAMWAVAAELAAIYLISNLPSPLYEGYREAFGFSEITLTLIYSVYVVGSIGTLFFLGRLSDQVGRRPVLLASFGLGGLSALVFLFAGSTPWLFVGRVLSGFAIALATGAGTAWILELHPRQDEGAATRTALVATSVGLGLGPLLSGVLAEYGPWPLRLSYLGVLPVLGLAALFAWRSEESVEDEKPLEEATVKPRLGVPRELLGAFITPAIAAFVSFALLGFCSSLLPTVITHALHVTNVAVGGAVVAGLFLVGALTIATAPSWKPRSGMLAGLVLLVPGTVCLVLAEALHAMGWLLLGTLIAGVATGLGYRFGLQRVNELSPDDRHAEVISSYLIVCYVGISLPVIGIGLVSSATSSLFADVLFGALIVALAFAALGYELWPSHRRQPAEA